MLADLSFQELDAEHQREADELGSCLYVNGEAVTGSMEDGKESGMDKRVKGSRQE